MLESREMIIASGVTKSFAGQVAVDDLSLSIGTGEIYALMGPDGAGKKRFKTFMICLCYYDIAEGKLKAWALDSDNEEELLKEFLRLCEGSSELAYLSYNRFDEKVLEGKWTTARRKKLDNPGPWPNVLVINSEFPWTWKMINSRKNKRVTDLRDDENIDWKKVINFGPDLDDLEEVGELRNHCFRDIVDLAFTDPEYRFNEEDVEKVLTCVYSESCMWI